MSYIVLDLQNRSCEGIQWFRWHTAIRRIGRLWAPHTGCNVIILSGSKNSPKTLKKSTTTAQNSVSYLVHKIVQNWLKTMSGRTLFQTYGIEVAKESDCFGGLLPSTGSEGSEPRTLDITLQYCLAQKIHQKISQIIALQNHPNFSHKIDQKIEVGKDCWPLILSL